MPTGYTAKLVEEGQPFNEFVMTCARAFGALIEMREDSMDTPIPDEIPDSTSKYHTEALERTRASLDRFRNMNVGECLEYGEARKAEGIRELEKSIAKVKAENQRIADMEKNVLNWVPPTPEHVELKNFMLQQLSVSYNSLEYLESSLASYMTKSPEEFYMEALKGFERDIEYHTEKLADSKKLGANRNKWVRDLRESLNQTPVTS